MQIQKTYCLEVRPYSENNTSPVWKNAVFPDLPREAPGEICPCHEMAAECAEWRRGYYNNPTWRTKKPARGTTFTLARRLEAQEDFDVAEPDVVPTQWERHTMRKARALALRRARQLRLSTEAANRVRAALEAQGEATTSSSSSDSSDTSSSSP